MALIGDVVPIGIFIWVFGAYVDSISTVFDTTIGRAFVVVFISLAVLGVGSFLIVFLFGIFAALVGFTPT
jgi:hypothetical protein